MNRSTINMSINMSTIYMTIRFRVCVIKSYHLVTVYGSGHRDFNVPCSSVSLP